MKGHGLDTRPSVWLLGPILSAFAIFSWVHQDIEFATLWGLIICVAYYHRFLVEAPTRQNWLGTVSIGIAAKLLCMAYYIVMMKPTSSLFQVLSHLPGIISVSCMMLIITTVWLSHLPGRSSRKTGPIIVCSSVIVWLSAKTMPTFFDTFNLLAFFGGSILLSLLAVGGGLSPPPARQHKAYLNQIIIVLGCVAAISCVTFTIIFGLHYLKPFLNQVLSDHVPSHRYNARLGIGDHIQISRQRRVTLSRRVIAIITGATNPGYLRTQVMTTYHGHRWTSDLTSPKPLVADWQPQGNSRYLFLPGGNPLLLNQPPTAVHQVRLSVNLQGAVPLPYTTHRVRTPATLSCLLTTEDLVQCSPPVELVTYTIEHQLTSPSIPYGIGAALDPLPQMAMSQLFLDNLHRTRTAPTTVVKPLRQLAHQLVGPAPIHPLQAAQTLQQYFKRHYTYSLDVNLAENSDPIVDFVLNRRPAYCEYFASGMVLLLRSLSIPARLVSGYVVWERHPGTHQWIVRQRDAHAWAEVYDDTSRRWVAFDATPSVHHQLFRQQWLGGTIDRSVIWLEDKLLAITTWANQGNIQHWLKRLGTHVLVYLKQPIIIVACFCMLCALLLRRWYKEQQELRHSVNWINSLNMMQFNRSEPEEIHHAITPHTQYHFERVAVALTKIGIPIQPSETLLEYCHRIAPDSTNSNISTLITTLINFTNIYKVLRFQPQAPYNYHLQLITLEHLANDIIQLASHSPDRHVAHTTAK